MAFLIGRILGASLVNILMVAPAYWIIRVLTGRRFDRMQSIIFSAIGAMMVSFILALVFNSNTLLNLISTTLDVVVIMLINMVIKPKDESNEG